MIDMWILFGCLCVSVGLNMALLLNARLARVELAEADACNEFAEDVVVAQNAQITYLSERLSAADPNALRQVPTLRLVSDREDG